MSITIRKGLIGKQDVKFYTAASPTFSRVTSSGGATTLTAVAATHIPIVQSAGSAYFSQNTVQRAVNETISRYFGKEHSLATYTAGAGVGDHYSVMGFKNGLAGTSIQAVASNMWLSTGRAKIFIPPGTYTLATAMNLPRNTIMFGAGHGTLFRGNATNLVSRIFTISGAVGATSSALTANATISKGTVNVSNGALFKRGDFVRIRDSVNEQYFFIVSVVGNVLTTDRMCHHTFRSSATIADVTTAYPAKLFLDNMRIGYTVNQANQGICVAATLLQESTIGAGVLLESGRDTSLLLNKGCAKNRILAISEQNFNATTDGAGVFINHPSSHDNYLSVTVDSGGANRNSGGFGNFTFGPYNNNASSAASMVINPFMSFYRANKPQLGYANYAGTVVVTCPASPSTPADVLMNGRIYRNTGTVLCDLSRTIAFTAATVGGMDRGPATATRALYIYAVPSYNVSATRQFDLIASTGLPSSGPTASATYPLWSFLQAVQTGSAGTIRLNPFIQDRDEVILQKRVRVATITSPASANATWKTIAPASIPSGSKFATFTIDATSAAQAQSQALAEFDMARGGVVNVNDFEGSVNGSSFNSNTGNVVFKSSSKAHLRISVNSTRQVAYRNTTAATWAVNVDLVGYTLDRAAFK